MTEERGKERGAATRAITISSVDLISRTLTATSGPLARQARRVARPT
jgi:hypothetical protein